MTQEFVYDMNQEMNEQYVEKFETLVQLFKTHTDPKIKIKMVKKLKVWCEDFTEYYDYLEDDVVEKQQETV